ncbi:MAG: HAMP domain-containing histidine kinase [Polyangiaceae bacterium]|nr:HAMP domain-containing histidine kinase [Polyangiaceae bacterium]
MRVATRMSVGSILALLPLIALLTYLLGRVQHLAEESRETSGSFQIAARALTLIQRLDPLEEYAQKHAVTQDERYAQRYSRTHEAIALDVQALHGLALGDGESAALVRFEQRWKRLPKAPPTETSPERQARFAADVSDLKVAGHAILDATQSGVSARAERALATSRSTTRLAWGVTALALSLTAIGFWVTLRGIQKPIKRLSSATREVSLGRFDRRVDPGGSDELVELSHAFNRMVSDLWELTRKRGKLLAQVSHDLKTPLVSIQETNGLLLDRIPGELTPEQERLLNLNAHAADRLSGLLTDLLDLARLEAGVRYQLNTNDLDALLRRALGEFEARAKERKVTLTLQSPGALLLQCDGQRLLQLVSNLLDNALKFTPQAGRVELTLRLANEHDVPEAPQSWLEKDRAPRYALVSVRDSGPGIPNAELEQIFDDFFQGQARSEVTPRRGVGLGLAICREIVAAHQGAIWARNAKPGAELFVLLPCLAQQPERSSPKPLVTRATLPSGNAV